MLQNYLKVAFRTLRKHKGYTFINIVGLAVGLACCLMIALFVRDELSYDRFHDDADRIYRVTIDAAIAEQEIRGPLSPAPMAATRSVVASPWPAVTQVPLAVDLQVKSSGPGRQVSARASGPRRPLCRNRSDPARPRRAIP